jgi:hypothetical protein
MPTGFPFAFCGWNTRRQLRRRDGRACSRGGGLGDAAPLICHSDRIRRISEQPPLCPACASSGRANKHAGARWNATAYATASAQIMSRIGA